MQSGKRQYMTGSGNRVGFNYMLTQFLLIAHCQCRKYGQFISLQTHIPI